MTAPGSPALNRDAACATRPSWWWFAWPVEKKDEHAIDPSDKKAALTAQATAIGICTSCPLLAECQRWGMQREQYGTWGGLTAHERLSLSGKGSGQGQKQSVDALAKRLDDRFRRQWATVGDQLTVWIVDERQRRLVEGAEARSAERQARLSDPVWRAVS